MSNGIRRVRAKIILSFFRLLPESRCFRVKVALLNFIGHNIHETARISSSIRLFGTGKISIGRETWVGPRVSFYVNTTTITIGEFCDIAPEVAFVTGSHIKNKHPDSLRRAGTGFCKPIEIGDRSWLCFRSVIHNSVNIPHFTVIPSNVVITSSGLAKTPYKE